MTDTTTEKTKEVTGYFGKPKQITRADFVSRWRAHAADLFSIVDNTEEYEAVKVIVENVSTMAGAKWDKMPG